jgi:hypothetical protein
MIKMKWRVTIFGEPVVDIYESENTRCWFITKKVQKEGQWFLSGYVRCFKPLMLAEFRHLPEETLQDMTRHIWKVPQDAWKRCPCVDIEEDCEGPKIVRCDEPDREAEASPSYSNDCKEVDKKMDESTKEKVDDYLEVFNEIKKKTDDSKVAIGLLSEICKDRRMQEIKEQKEANNNEPATEKQKRFMKNLGIDFPKSVTKKEATMLIDEELGKNNNSG